MKKLILIASTFFLVFSSTYAANMEYERRAFRGRYGLWSGVQCMADSIRVTTESDESLLARYPVLQIGADAKSELSRIGFPDFCDPSIAPAPGTMVSVELHVRTVTDRDGSLAFFVQLRAAMPDGDFVRKSFGQFTRWESDGSLGQTAAADFRGTIREAVSEQVDGFKTFMNRTRLMAQSR